MVLIGMVLGGIVGIWFGTSYGSMRKTELAAQGEFPNVIVNDDVQTAREELIALVQTELPLD